MSTIYEIIDQLCAEKGISGSKMCDDLGMSRSTLTEFILTAICQMECKSRL